MKNLVKYLLISLTFTSGYCCKSQQNADSVIITGKIAESNSKIVVIKYEDSIFETKFQYISEVDSTGFFNVRFKIDYAQDVHILYDDNLETLIVHPGDSIHISFNGKRGIKELIFSGDGAVQNSKIFQFGESYAKIANSEDYRAMKKKLNPDGYRSFIKNFREKCDSMIFSLQADDETTNWMHNNIKYRCFEELCKYGQNYNIASTSSYYSFVDDYVKNNKDGLLNSRFTDLIDYYRDFEKSRLVQDSLNVLYSKKDYSSLIDFTINFYEKLNNEIANIALTKELFKYLKDDVESVEKQYERYKIVVKNEFYAILLKQNIDKFKNQSSKKEYITINELGNEKFVNQIFKEISNKYNGNVLYIDFWGIHCGPCIKEFPYAKVLHDSLAKKDIVFINFCTDTNKVEWKKAIEKYDIYGCNYILTNDQVAYLNYILDFSGTPTYMIVDKKGRFVNTHADRPSSSEIIKSELIKHSQR